MDIPQSVQDLLKCDECDELLSCGPVFMMHDTGETICGRCSHRQHHQAESENRNKTRIYKYEAAAKLLRFPCSYTKQGCREVLDFSAEEPNTHELTCEFKSFLCPMVPISVCSWVGSWKTVEAHCRDKHISHVLGNDCNLPKPDLSTSNFQNYLIIAFNFLFLLQVEVCLVSGKLFHSLRMFGDSKFLQNFSFNLIIERHDIYLSKLGVVSSAHSVTLLKATSICTKINGLLEILNEKYLDTKFMIKIRVKRCFYCSNEMNNVSDFKSETKCCLKCDEQIVKCKYHVDGCFFADYNEKKCRKHEDYFCKYPVKCFLCNVDLDGGAIFVHFESYSSCRDTTKCDIDSVVRVTPNIDNKVKYILISNNDNDTINIITIYFSDCFLKLWLWTSFSLQELKNMECSVILTDPQTNYTETVIPPVLYDDSNDWHINIKIDHFPSWETLGIDLSVAIGAKL